MVLSSHAVSLFALALPMIFWCLSYVHPMLLVPPTSLNAWPTDYFTIWSLGTLLPQNVELVMLMYFVCSLCFLSLGGSTMTLPASLLRGGQWSDQPVAYCPARPPELIRSHPSFISAPPRAFVFQLQFHPSSFIPPPFCYSLYLKTSFVH